MIVFARKGPATLTVVSRMRDALARRLADLRFTQCVRDDITIAVAEACANIVLHATPKATSIDIQLRLEGATLVLEIRDNGGSFHAFDDMFSSLEGVNQGFDLRESGRGLLLIASALERVTYQSGPPNLFSGRWRIHAQRPRVLIVEDDDAQREMYGAFLNKEWEVMLAASVSDALLMAATMTCDVVICDLHVGDADGSELFGAIGAGDETPGPAFVVLSADEQTESRRRALGRGIEFFLRKPVSGQALRECVALSLERHAAREARLAHVFTRHVERLWETSLPSTVFDMALLACADTAATGGGDIIIHHRSDDRLRIVLADVIGHGLAAKAWSIALAAAIRALMQRYERRTCGQFLQALNAVLCRDDAFNAALSTLIVVDIMGRGRLTYASAGHPAPVRLLHGVPNVCAQGGPLLGVIEAAVYDTHTLELEPGERLLMFTDGVDAAEVAAGGPLPSWLLDAAGKSDFFATQGRALSDAAAARLGAQPSDDWTVIVLESRESIAVA